VAPGTPFRDILTHFFTRRPELCGNLSAEATVEQRLRRQRHQDEIWEQQINEQWVLVSDRVAADGGLVSLRTDITNFKRIEKDLSQAKATAEAASIAKSRFLANMSHEWRTPLNGVIGMLQLVEAPAMPAPYADYIGIALRSGRALLGLINELLDFSKIEANGVELEQAEFELRQLVEDAAAALAEQSRAKGLFVELVIADDVPVAVRGDPLRLRQVLMNLLGNAVKFTADGEVRLVVLRRMEDGRIEFEVSDTGIGIPPEALADVFSPFTQAESTTTRRFGGTGLGLAISQQLVTLMGGKLRVESMPGEGSSFRFDANLPPVVGKAAPKVGGPQETTAAAERPPMHGHALIVDDIAVNLQVAAALLRRMGLTVECVTSRQAALVCAGERRYDLIFMDCQMPQIDGYETTGALRQQLGAACPPIIAMTAHAGIADLALCLEAGMDDYLPKPVALDTLRDITARWLSAQTVNRQGGIVPSRAQLRTHILPVLDDSAIESLRDMRGERELAALFEVFKDTVDAHLQSLALALAGGDRKRVRQLVHAVTGVSANVGARQLASLAGALSVDAENPDVVLTPARIDALAASLAAVEDTLNTARAAA
jgi:signal transduction histidine kinase/CheY-like chemotaxis protein/HPt (histidine-containing phosphotransfer) domain-containing protein